MSNNIILDGTKLLWHTERLQQWLSGEKIAPHYIEAAITTHCTYHCEFCYGKLQRKDTDALTRDEVFSFLHDAADIGVKAIALIGDGENTCNPALCDAIVYGKSQGLDMALGTNGYLLTEQQIEAIMPCLTYLRFNISAGTAEGYCKIHGVAEKCYEKVLGNIQKAVAFKQKNNLPVTIGLQMVLLPQYKNEIMPLAELGKKLGVDYLVIKHCSDDEHGSLGVDYDSYSELTDILHQAEALSSDSYQVQAKWSKILSHGTRSYQRCYGPAFVLQISGSGIVAPCGMFFNDQYKKYHLGSLKTQTFRQIWESPRYSEVLNFLRSEKFNAQTDCGTLCHQHKVNEALDCIMKNGGVCPPAPEGPKPMHINFI